MPAAWNATYSPPLESCNLRSPCAVMSTWVNVPVDAPTVTPSMLPPLISHVVTLPRSAHVFEAAVQFCPMTMDSLELVVTNLR